MNRRINSNSHSAEDALEDLLSEPIDAASKRRGELFSELIGERPVVLFGAGGLGKKILKGLREKGIEPINFADNDVSKHWEVIDGLTVLPPKEAARRFSNIAAFVVTVWSPHHRYLDTRQQLWDLGCKSVAPFQVLLWRFSDVMLPYYQFGLPETILAKRSRVMEAYRLMHDEKSRAQYVAHVRWRLWLDFEGLPCPSEEDQYFPADIISLHDDEVFVDAGAFCGDTIRDFINRAKAGFGRIVAYEPDPSNFYKLTEYISSLPIEIRRKISAHNLAVGDSNRKVSFLATGTSAAMMQDDGSVEVDCIRMDEVLNGVQPSYIKFDIEGAESEALVGVQALIESTMPKLAVSVYHKPDDLWELPLFVHSLGRAYCFHLRTHEEDGRDVVAYAVLRA
ncbi:MAG: FkbM family methyltransferase [Dehalococcoidia bacterium]|nr:FkbM family methyltransferase [Dehalococcoidia bacterium]